MLCRAVRYALCLKIHAAFASANAAALDGAYYFLPLLMPELFQPSCRLLSAADSLSDAACSATTIFAAAAQFIHC